MAIRFARMVMQARKVPMNCFLDALRFGKDRLLVMLIVGLLYWEG
jgi:hypothetical protein